MFLEKLQMARVGSCQSALSAFGVVQPAGVGATTPPCCRETWPGVDAGGDTAEAQAGPATRCCVTPTVELTGPL